MGLTINEPFKMPYLVCDFLMTFDTTNDPVVTELHTDFPFGFDECARTDIGQYYLSWTGNIFADPLKTQLFISPIGKVDLSAGGSPLITVQLLEKIGTSLDTLRFGTFDYQLEPNDVTNDFELKEISWEVRVFN